MLYDWYLLFNLPNFLATGLTSRVLFVLLEGIGQASFVISRGNWVSVTYEGAFLPVNCLGENPYKQGTYAVYCDADENVWFGFEVSE